MRMQTMLVTLALILSACGTPSTPMQLPTETPLPPSPAPTETPLPPPTDTPQPSPTPDPLLFRDGFDGALDPAWQWMHEKPAYWSLTKAPGWLRIMARSGGVASGTMNNLLVQKAPDGNFQLQTALKFMPAGNYQIAGLLIYESPKQHIQFGRAFCNAKACAGDGFYLDLITGGNLVPENFATAAPKTDIVFLRLDRQGNDYTAYASENARDWRLIGSHTVTMKPLFVGLIAGQAYGSVPGPAEFDYFLINRLP